jgi:hypothetical protein
MQMLVVSIIVAVAAGYAGWLLMPQGVRRWLVGRLMVVAPSRRAWLARVASNAENGGCSSCRGCAARGRVPASPGQQRIGVVPRMQTQALRRPVAGGRP